MNTVTIDMEVAETVLDYLSRVYWYYGKDKYFNRSEDCCRAIYEAIQQTEKKMWKKVTDEQPPIGAAVLLSAKVGTEWRYMAVPKWTEVHAAIQAKKQGIYWTPIVQPKTGEENDR